MPALSIVDLSAEEMQALASRMNDHAFRRQDGTLALDASASDLGVTPAVLQQVQAGVAQLNGALTRKAIVLDEQLGLAPAEATTAEAADALDDSDAGWIELDNSQTQQLEIAMGMVAAVAVLAAVVFGILTVIAAIYVPPIAVLPAALTAVALYVAINAIWFKMKISFANKGRGVRIRFRLREGILGIFLVYNIDVESL